VTTLKNYPDSLAHSISNKLLQLDTGLINRIEISYRDWSRWLTLGIFDKGLWCNFEGIPVHHSSVKPGSFSIVFDPD
jgi:hypothetical protein